MKITSQSDPTHNGPSRMHTIFFSYGLFPMPIAESLHLPYEVKHKADGRREEEMRNQNEIQSAKMECTSHGSAFGFLVAGLGIGAALSVFLAPKSGVETRKWIATKCLDGVETANAKVHQVRLRMHELVDQGQEKVSAAVNAGREAVAKPGVETRPEAV
jgi:gas vesicle protein